MMVWSVTAIPVMFMLAWDAMRGLAWLSGAAAGTRYDLLFASALFSALIIACAIMLTAVDMLLGPQEVLRLEHRHTTQRDRGLP